METILLIVICIMLVALIILVLFVKPAKNNEKHEINQKIGELNNYLFRIESGIKEDFKINREENAAHAKSNRDELNNTIKEIKADLSELMKNITEQNQKSIEKLNISLENKTGLLTEKTEKALKDFQTSFENNVKSFNDLQRQKFGDLETRQNKMLESTEKKLEQMRETVDEKLQKTLNERLGQSFETVGKQLQAVQEGLGEMKNLAQDVGGLKKVLSNVKMRGGIGEVQLSMLLDQILAPEQFQANVKTKSDSEDIVEFAIKLPGRDENQQQVWLPVDAKFPKDVYEQLQNAYDNGDVSLIETAQKNLETTIKKMAKDISEKYIDPPNTTDFGIMFLPFEGIYAEVVRKASLLEDLQRNYKIVVTGPSTLAAILNSLQMGFKTLAIQKRSSEVWQILGAVKKEFDSFGGMMQKAQKNIQTGLDQLEDVVGKRTRAIQRKLRSVEALADEDARLILPELSDNELAEENDHTEPEK